MAIGRRIMDVLKKILTLMIYLAMAAMVCMFFTGNGQFIYEGF